ncbi:hypothetical protein [Rhodopseudomonas palustris]|uniref:hypothetical protein n=1 Tax=Rhodopseudomonas palustris TaxID=1076 RepID=UPI001A9D53FE|nr:hypothetical protein [Rhodopseudomonas palustris]
MDTNCSSTKNLRRDRAAAYLRERYGLRCAATTLKKYASRGGGPRFHRVNRTALYPLAELDKWAAQKLGPLHGHAADRASNDFDTTTGAAAPALN